MLWPKDGKMYKVSSGDLLERISAGLSTYHYQEDIRGIYDGSIFHTWATQVERERKQKKQ